MSSHNAQSCMPCSSSTAAVGFLAHIGCILWHKDHVVLLTFENEMLLTIHYPIQSHHQEDV